ncbi:MAG: hypothetical protein KBD37_02055, partial [Burkholderiales bacterium]|nr:hypothetical protein [Burkholderiales bacterium]
ITENNYAFNIQVTVLPFEDNGRTDVYVDYRLKSHYSPSEARELLGYGYLVPKNNDFSNLKLYNWNNVVFSALNCYEFADVDLRKQFRSEIDILVIGEFNPDTVYFSNLVEASSRDLHCYVIQANSAQYGDSRVCSPASTLKKDIMKVKGGKNPVTIVSELNIVALREFQLITYELQQEKEKNPHQFKPTPPGFDISKVKKRINQ